MRRNSVLTIFLAGTLSVQAQFTTPVLYNAGPLPEAIAAGDLDGDGDKDLVVANRQGAPQWKAPHNDSQRRLS